MNISLPEPQQAIVDDLIAAGRYSSVDEAVIEGIRLLSSQEQLRQQIQMGIEQADRGEVLSHEAVFDKLRADLAAIGAR